MDNPKTTRTSGASVTPSRGASATPSYGPTSMSQSRARPHFDNKPYLQRLQSLENSFPALKSFLRVIGDDNDRERQIVESWYRRNHKRGPGRCFCLKFEEAGVSSVAEDGFQSPDSLRKYLEKNPATESREVKKHRRLFILEDMESDYVDALGHYLGVDPLTFSEQANTWNFTDSVSIPYRGLPSMSKPEQAFTLRYYELRTLFDSQSVDKVSLQMTFSVNKRRYERWRDIDVPSSGKPDRRHAFVRRCASFWTSQDPTADYDLNNGPPGWDAVILVDPAFVATSRASKASQANTMPVAYPTASQPSKSATDPSPRHPSNAVQVNLNQTWPVHVNKEPPASTSNRTATFLREKFTPKTLEESYTATLEAVMNDGLEKCLVLKNPRNYPSRAALWKAQELGASQKLQAIEHESWPYHHGVSTLAPLMFSQIGIGAQKVDNEKFRAKRDLVSPLDEMVFYWTTVATPKLIEQTNAKSSNAAYYLLKYVAQHWVNQLELINTTIAKAEWFADDYQAQIDDALSLQKWKADLTRINDIAQDINYMRRHLNHFSSAMILNLERLGVQLGSENIDAFMGLAIRDAQRDFLTIYTRMQPLRDRAEALGSVPSDLANLRAAFRGVHDSEFSLRLSLFASVVFPLTLVAGIFSMGDDYRPGKPQFWKLWAIGPPLCMALALGLIYGRRPWKVFNDIGDFFKIWLRYYGIIGPENPKAGRKVKDKEKREKMAKVAEGIKSDEESRA